MIQNLNQFNNNSIYSLDNSLDILQKLDSANFLESVELHLSLNINYKDIKQQVQGSIILPNSIEKNKKIVVFSEDLEHNVLKNLDVSVVNFNELFLIVNSGSINFDILITNQKNISKLSSISRLLGTKGLMPSFKNSTLSNNFEKTIKEFKEGKINYKTDKYGIIHLVFGKVNFSKNQLKENLLCILEQIKKNKPIGVKGNFFKSLYICTTMGPSIKVLTY